MFSTLRQVRLTPSFAIATAALLVSLGGTSYAAVKINTDDIEKGAVTGGKVKDESLGSRDVRDGTLRGADFNGKLPAGPRGPAGPAGPPGADRWVLVAADGTIEAQSGGFKLVAGYPTLPNSAPDGSPSNALRANGNVYIDAGNDLSDNGIVASIALQNRINQDGGGTAGRDAGPDANAEFSGEISVSKCGVTDATPTNCAPPGAQNNSSFVVSPRMSDGSVTNDSNRKRFYVVIAGK